LNPTKVADLNFSADTALNESIVIAIATASGTEQFTIHRPIGITNLDRKEDWVVTRTIDVQSLLDRATRPDQKAVDARRQNALYTNAALSIPDVTYANGTIRLGGQDRSTLTKTARKAAQEAVAKGTVLAPDAYISHMPGNLRAIERRLREFLSAKDNHEAVEQAHPYANYSTRSGPTAATEQVAKVAWEGLTINQVRDNLFRGLVN